MTLDLPVVRVRRLAAPHARALVDEGADWYAALAVLVVSLVLAALGGAAVLRGAAVENAGAILAGSALAAAGLAGAWLALGETMRRERVVLHADTLTIERRGLAGQLRLEVPLSEYAGLAVLDRTRRFHIRNQDRPPTGRRGPVTEFVVVLRHRRDAARNVELFRAQPSLETLRAMHALHAAASAGSARAAQADACHRLAAGYRDALVTLARRLSLPALVHAQGGEVSVDDPTTLDEWLAPRA